jgi:hypothetical protein
LNESEKANSFTIEFQDKAIWNSLKDDFKSLLRENEIKYQYSEKVPSFHLIYQSVRIKIRIDWKDENLIVYLLSQKNLTQDELNSCNEIFDLLQIFDGELIAGRSPYEWNG